MPRFPTTYCSQCGAEFGPGDAGFSHCKDHMDNDASTPGQPAEIVIRFKATCLSQINTVNFLTNLQKSGQMKDLRDRLAADGIGVHQGFPSITIELGARP